MFCFLISQYFFSLLLFCFPKWSAGHVFPPPTALELFTYFWAVAVFTSSESLAYFHIVLCGAYLCFHPGQVINLGLYLILMKRSSAPLPHTVLVESLGLGTSLTVQRLGINPCFHCRQHRFDLWSEIWSHMPCIAAKKKKKNTGPRDDSTEIWRALKMSSTEHIILRGIIKSVTEKWSLQWDIYNRGPHECWQWPS